MILGGMTEELVGDVTEDAIFVDRLSDDVGGPGLLHVLLVPGASGVPIWFYNYLSQVLTARGVPQGNLELAHIASVDDSSTPNEDESTWQNGAYQASEVAKIVRANVVWFSGGDQSRLVNLLVDSSGKDTPFQAALKARFAAKQLILTGYSAGAAVMSDPMIGGGTSFNALSVLPDPSCESSDSLCVTRGLGYLPSGLGVIVDQHFFQRGRFARLVRALAATNQKTGWGVGAYTGFYVDLDAQKAEVVGVPGKSFVCIVGREGAAQNHEQPGPPFLGDNYAISVLATGDTYSLPDADHPHGVGIHPVNSEYYAPFSQYYDKTPVLTDAFGSNVLSEDVAAYVADGAPQSSGARVDAIAFDTDESGAATGFLARFTADADTQVAWNEEAGYSMFSARLKLGTISARFAGLRP
jgi:cyanophycinase